VFAQNSRHEKSFAACPGDANETVEINFVAHCEVDTDTARARKQSGPQ
jgi:hypothetical protein